MLKIERHQLILDKLKVNRKVLSAILSSELNVSEDTIRRDLKELEAKQLLYKVHGGALSIENRILSYNERSVSDLDKKKKIAKKAVKLIHEGQVIIMSGSSTNLELAKLLPPSLNVTIFTYSLPIALQLTKHPKVEVIFLGGKLNKTAQVTVGIDVMDSISKLRADICFMGTDAINIDRGITESDWEVAHIKKCMIASSDYVVSMCINTKIMESRRYAVVPIDKIDAIITDDNTNQSVYKRFKEKGLVVM
ncbi:DeoR/GlpR transcriptional regulator [Aureibaculum marinum]|uniref:DeoR/GlpR transcriptional regulator n=1 Tax=Aureibaculum marinum TaxID=2487930 RepID=A0A3N4NMH1_9FLAO|nr:DeoR/GlpR family DNA-binding transcription regulator [Aureibaculum marinum]RPD96745.1 DeoR/GlpR transcriptional regulator [Aureibaculum marinum]